MELTGETGKKYQINSTAFAGGGEGNIHEIVGMDGYVAKIYKDDLRTTERKRKLQAMVKIRPVQTGQYAWPTDLLYENGRFVGFVMPKVTGKKKLHNIYVYDKRAGKPWALYVAIACNLAAAVHDVHELGQVIGDLNPENILADSTNGLVTLVDTDSYHISDGKHIYRCGVGRPEFVPAELQGKNLGQAPFPTFTKETDRFALAVMIFSLLMNGNHPFACKVSSGSASALQPVENIKNCVCAYFPDTRPENVVIPPTAPELSSLPQNIQLLFHRAFVDGHKNPGLRPTAEDWYLALGQLRKMLKQCPAHSEHWYFQSLHECPWCEVNARMAETRKNPSSIGSAGNVGNARNTTNAGNVRNTGNAGNAGNTGNAGNAGVIGGAGGNTGYGTGYAGQNTGFLTRIITWILKLLIEYPLTFILGVFYLLYDILPDWLGKVLKWIISIALSIGIFYLLFLGGRAIVRGIGHLSHKNPTESMAPAVPGESQTTVSETEANNSQSAPVQIAIGGREEESNNTRDTANRIEVNTKYTGSLSGKRNTEKDWYTFTLDRPGKLSFTVYTKKQGIHIFTAPIYWNALIVQENGNYRLADENIRYDKKETNLREIEVNAGTYYFLMQSGKSKYSDDDYSFVIRYTPYETLDHEIEPNGVIDAATVIDVGTTVSGDLCKKPQDDTTDWYTFTAPSNGRFRVRFTAPLAENDGKVDYEMNVVRMEEPDRDLWDGELPVGEEEETLLPYIDAAEGETFGIWIERIWIRPPGSYSIYVEFEELQE